MACSRQTLPRESTLRNLLSSGQRARCPRRHCLGISADSATSRWSGRNSGCVGWRGSSVTNSRRPHGLRRCAQALATRATEVPNGRTLRCSCRAVTLSAWIPARAGAESARAPPFSSSAAQTSVIGLPPGPGRTQQRAEACLPLFPTLTNSSGSSKASATAECGVFDAAAPLRSLTPFVVETTGQPHATLKIMIAVPVRVDRLALLEPLSRCGVT